MIQILSGSKWSSKYWKKNRIGRRQKTNRRCPKCTRERTRVTSRSVAKRHSNCSSWIRWRRSRRGRVSRKSWRLNLMRRDWDRRESPLPSTLKKLKVLVKPKFRTKLSRSYEWRNTKPCPRKNERSSTNITYIKSRRLKSSKKQTNYF